MGMESRNITSAIVPSRTLVPVSYMDRERGESYALSVENLCSVVDQDQTVLY
jgi:Cu2+-containing amine oxidase